MATTANRATETDIRRVPATFALPDWPMNAWYAAAYDVEVTRALWRASWPAATSSMYRPLGRRARRAGRTPAGTG